MNRREFTQALLAGCSATLINPVLAAGQPDPERSPWAIAFRGLKHDLPEKAMQVSGRIPDACHGTLYRNGPALFERAGQRYGHWFDPDGMIQAFALDGRGVSHRGRFVRTQKYLAEEAAGRILYNGAGTKINGALPPRNNNSSNVANINVQPFGNELLALWEGGSAYSIDPASLATRGIRDWSDELAGAPFSAHPRFDENGDLWNFGSLPIPGINALVIYHIAANGRLKNSSVFRQEFGGYQHDFVLTPNYLIFLNSSAVAHDGDTFVDRFRWEPDRPSQLMIFNKQDLSLKKVIEVPPVFVFHFGNGWEENGKIIFTAAQYRNSRFMTHGMARLAKGLSGPYEDDTRLMRYEIDLAKGMAVIDDLGTNLEFPGFDRRHPFRPQAVLGVSDQREREGSLQSTIALVDPETGRQQRYDYGPGLIVEEPQFIPTGANSTDGYILHSFLNYQKESTGIAILRSDALADGPIVVAEMERCLTLGFHGCFVAA